MAFVALAACVVTLQGKSGAIYQLPITKASAVGFVTFTQDGQTFYNLPEDCRVIDATVGDSVNAGDYLDIYLNSIQKIQARMYVLPIKNATTIPHTAPSSWMKKDSQLSFYYYSA